MQRIWGKLSLVAVDAILISLAYVTAFVLRLGPRETFEASPTIIRTLPVLLTVSLIVHLRHGLFNAILRYASLDTLIAVVRSVTISVLLSCLLLFLLFRLETVPRSIFIIYFMTALLLIGGVRFIVRVRRTDLKPRKGCRRVLLYGVGDTAALVLRGLGISRHLGYSAVGLIDDDPLQRGRHYLGIQVHGTPEILPGFLAEQEVDELWVCRTDVPGADLRRLYELTEGVEISIKILPRLEHALLGRDLGRFQEPDIDDLDMFDARHKIYFLKIQAGLARAQVAERNASRIRFTNVRGQPQRIRFKRNSRNWGGWTKFQSEMDLPKPQATAFQLKSRLGVLSDEYALPAK